MDVGLALQYSQFLHLNVDSDHSMFQTRAVRHYHTTAQLEWKRMLEIVTDTVKYPLADFNRQAESPPVNIATGKEVLMLIYSALRDRRQHSGSDALLPRSGRFC